MGLGKIKSENDYLICLEQVEELLNKKVAPDTEEGETLKNILILIKQYEDIHYPIPINS